MLALCVGLVAQRPAGATIAETSTFATVADAYVSAASPRRNFGSGRKLELAASPVERAYLRFNVTGLAGAVAKATLRVRATNRSRAGIAVRPAANVWSERRLTYANAPRPGRVTNSSGRFAARTWVSLDVTRLVRGAGPVTFVLTTRSAVAVDLASREAGASLAAQLVVRTAAIPPALASAPTISGSTVAGQTLTASPGAWSGTQPVSYAYQWLRCSSSGGSCTNVGEGASSYGLIGADIGSTMRVAVTASNVAGQATAQSAPSAVVSAPPPPANTGRPSVTGTAAAGQTLSASPGAWSGTQPISFAYQWARCIQDGSVCANASGRTGATYALGVADVGAVIRVSVTATNFGGSTRADSAITARVAAQASGSGDPVIAAAGDIACDPTVLAGSPNPATQCNEQATSNLLVGAGLAAVLALGDNQYNCGGLSAYTHSYDPTWGRVKSITHPVPGNHEYLTSGGTDCDASGHAGGYFTYFGAAAGGAGKGYYSFDVGSWHLIALNSNCSAIGGCGAGSPQESWLVADLASHRSSCTLAYWHHPRFSSGSAGDDTEVASFWQDLIAGGADVVLNGHAHGYERFAPQTAGQAYDPTGGLRQFVAGTGGEDFQPFTSSKQLSEARNNGTFGVLLLTLHAGGYDWRFAPVAGSSFSDSGSASCH